MGDFFKRGKCGWCETVSDGVYKDTHLCEECDSETVWCFICKQRQHRDSRCRHVFQDEHFDWCGAGVGPHPTDAAKDGLFKMLDLMPPGFAPGLAKAIRSGRFHTWFIAPMIGSGGSMWLHGMPDREGRSTELEWGQEMIEVGESDHADETADGYRWLASLYERKTPKANAVTLALLAEWQMRHDMRTDDIACW